jgi:hypothetical protein
MRHDQRYGALADSELIRAIDMMEFDRGKSQILVQR